MHWPTLSYTSLAIGAIVCRGQVSASTITAAPVPLVRRQDSGTPASCTNFYNAEEACIAQTSDFLSLSFAQQASCLCYSSSQWAPTIYDGYVSTCIEYLSTASPSYYTSLGGDSLPTDPCAELLAASMSGAANTITATTSTTSGAPGAASTTAAAGTGAAPNSAACLSWEAIASSCAEATPLFTGLAFSQEASCLCYTSKTVYAPAVFDGYWAACLSYYKTADPSFYSTSLSGDSVTRTPCAAEGDVLSNSGGGATPTPPSSSSGAATAAATSSSTSSPATVTLVLTTTAEPTATSSSGAAAGAVASTGWFERSAGVLALLSGLLLGW